MTATPVTAPMAGTVVLVAAEVGDQVRAGQQLVVLESMKMEHVVAAPVDGRLTSVEVAADDLVEEGARLATLEPAMAEGADASAPTPPDLDAISPQLQEVRDRHAVTADGARPDAVARRHRAGQRTARENVADLCDPDSFVEYGALAIAAQRRRRDLDDLIRRTPADGIVTGIGMVNGEVLPAERARTVVLAYDATVLAGTQGLHSHRKTDRMLELAEREQLPVVLFAEGGGGRPGDTDVHVLTGLETTTFASLARLSGRVPLVGIVSGRCFAGNAVLLGCCDLIIATQDANIGMAGPAMIEGGGLGSFQPEDIGPVEDQAANGVIDVVVADEAEAVQVAKRYLALVQGAVTEGDGGDQRTLRHAIPEDRRTGYDVRQLIAMLVDDGSLLELREGFAPGMVTGLARVDGKPLGVLANDPMHMGGAITSEGADKAVRFLQLCESHGLPVLSLCDTPGMMVGPEAERTALVRHCSRMFLVLADLQVPFMSIVTRRGFGLGAQAMTGGHLKAGVFTVAWPNAELGPMGPEGQVRLGFRDELAAIEDEAAREARFAEMLAELRAESRAVNVASYAEIDDVIDPADTRRWIASALAPVPYPRKPQDPGRRFIDAW